MRFSSRLLIRLLRALFTGALILVAAVFLGALMPRNADWRSPDQGVPVFIRSNGVHTDIVMPARALGVDWSALAPAAHVRRPDLAGGWVAIGTGERETFLNTPRWRDIRARTVIGAIFGGELLLHVEHIGQPRPGPQVRALTLAPEQYRLLAAAIAPMFRRDGQGEALPLRDTGYGANDIFYLALGRYDALRNCNQWTADTLARAGVRVGRWTPLAPGVLASLR